MPTLYIATQGACVSREAERLVVSLNHQKLTETPIRRVDLVALFGRVEITTPALELCMSRQVDVSFLSLSGRPKGRAHGRLSRHIELRRAQYVHYDALRERQIARRDVEAVHDSRSDPGERAFAVCRSIVCGKIANSAVILRRSARYRGNTGALESARELADINCKS